MKPIRTRFGAIPIVGRPWRIATAVLVATLAIDAAANTAHAQGLPSAAELVARHDSLVGGRALLEAHSSMRVRGAMTIPAAGIEAPFEIRKRKPNAYRFEASLGPGAELRQGFDGAIAWAIQGDQPMILEGDQRDQIVNQADFYADLHDPAQFTAMETVRETRFADRACYEVRMTRVNGDVVYEYFDVESGLSAGGSSTVQSGAGTLTQTSIFTDYRTFDGYRMATRIVQQNPQFEVILSIDSVSFDDVDASEIAPPDTVRALSRRPTNGDPSSW